MNISLEMPSLSFPLFKARSMYKIIWSFRPPLDLSCNKLTGPIRPSFENLNKLHVLGPQNNHLSGIIPYSLLGLKSLGFMDLSQNELSGEIPMSSQNLSFLQKFNDSNNQLHGEIPTGGQLLTFPRSSFEGNRGLRGGDLPPCQPHQTPHTQIQPVDEKMSIIVLQFGFGAVIGFLLTVGLCFKRCWVFLKP